MRDAPASRPSPREWLGSEPFPWPAPDEVEEGGRIVACYCVASKQVARTKTDKPYLRLQLADRSGEIEGRVWDDAERIDAEVAEGGFVGVRGRIESYRGQRQLKVEEIVPITVAPEDLELFLPRTPHGLDALESELDALIDSVEDPALNTLLTRLLGRDSATGRAFRRAPAAKRNHHAYVGGLLEHTVSVAWVCSALARHYGDALDRDLLVAGALVHDIGKVREIDVSGGFPYTDEGKLLGHIVLGIQMVRDAAREVPGLSESRALLLQHLVASHQGKYEWQSPKIPVTLEALLLHYVDDLDAKMHQALALVAAAEKGWTGYDPAFGRSFLRHRDLDAQDAGRTDDAPGEPMVDAPGAESGGEAVEALDEVGAAPDPVPADADTTDASADDPAEDLPWFEAGEDAQEPAPDAPGRDGGTVQEEPAASEPEVPHDASGGEAGGSTGADRHGAAPRPLRFDDDTLDLFEG